MTKLDSAPQNTDSISRASSDVNWQRLSLWSIVHFSVSNIKNLASGAIYAIPAVAIGAKQFGEFAEFWLPIATALSFLTIFSGWINYFFYRFKHAADYVEIKSGVFNRVHTHLPFEKIQNVKIDEPIYYRWTKRAVITLDTAGSAQEEANIVAVPLDYAVALKRAVLAQRQTVTQSSPTSQVHRNGAGQTDPLTDNEVVLNRRTLKDLVLHGVTNNRMWIILGALAPFYERIAESVLGWFKMHTGDIDALLGEGATAWWYWSTMSLLVAVIVVSFMTLVSIAGSIFVFYGYTLTTDGKRYIRRSGLINKQEVGMKKSRIQIIKMQQDWLDRILKRVNLYFEQNVTGTEHTNELKANNKLLVPSVTIEQCDDLSADVFVMQRARTSKYMPISRRYVHHMLGMRFAPVYLFVLSLLLYANQWQAALVSVVVASVISIFVYLRWKKWGVAADNKYIYIRKGIIGVDYYCFPLGKLQQLKQYQSIFMRKYGLSSITFVLASGPVTVPYLAQSAVDQLGQICLDEVVLHKPAWM